MKKWLLLSVAIIVAMIVALVLIVQAFTPTPIPDPPTIPDGPLAIHINEIDLSTRGMVLISIDNLTREDITVEVSKLGAALNEHLRIYDPIGNEWVWVNAVGATGRPFATDDAFWQWNSQWNTSGTVSIGAGRTENFNLAVEDVYTLTAEAWAARLHAVPARLVYVIDCEIPVTAAQDGVLAVRVTAKGEAAYKPRP